MRERVTTWLDVLGLLLIALGVGALLYPFIYLGAAVASGAVVLIGSSIASRGKGGGT